MVDDYRAPFPATMWTLIRQAKDKESDDYRRAMNELAISYWRPVFFFLRTKGHPLHRAEDLTQEFFLTLMERGWITKADPARGKFRTFLLTVLVRFLSDHGTTRAPKQTLFDNRLVSISTLITDGERSFEPATDETPDAVFMKQWALVTIQSVMKQLATWCESSDHPEWYRIFQSMHFPPDGSPSISQVALAERLAISRDQVRYALQQTNTRFAELLRAEVADQVDLDTDIEEELATLEHLL